MNGTDGRRGYVDIVRELTDKFPDPSSITTDTDKKAFVKLFGEYLRAENVLKNYDEYTALQAYQKIDKSDETAVKIFQEHHHLTDDELIAIQNTPVLSERVIQDSRSVYNDIRDWLRQEQDNNTAQKSQIDWSDVVFEVELLKSQEINLDFILELIFEYNKKHGDKQALAEEIRRTVRASIDNRGKESLIMDFIEQTNLDAITDKAAMIDEFYAFAQAEQSKEAHELITKEELNTDAAKRYIATSLRREYASDKGTELNDILPKMSPLNPNYLTKKKTVFEKIATFVEKFKGIGNIVGLWGNNKENNWWTHTHSYKNC